MDSSILMIYLSAFLSLILPTFLSGLWFYNEITAKSDYLKISLSGINFKSTPVAFHGFFPKKGNIPFKSIKYATLITITTRLDISEKCENRESFKELLDKPLVLQIVYAEDKKVLIGERFPNKKLIHAILLIETGAGLSQTWKKISEKFPALKDIITDVSSKLSGWFKRN